VNNYRIKVMNAIASEGLALFGERYQLDENEEKPQGLVVRSSPVELGGYPDLLAIARAGAGVNNIPIDEASERESAFSTHLVPMPMQWWNWSLPCWESGCAMSTKGSISASS
jgi:hypothetical protein